MAGVSVVKHITLILTDVVSGQYCLFNEATKRAWTFKIHQSHLTVKYVSLYV